MFFKDTVRIKKEFKISVPKGRYSDRPEEIGDERCLVFLCDEANESYTETYGDDLYSFETPYTAPKCLLFNSPVPITAMRQFALMTALGIKVELKSPAIREKIRDMVAQLCAGMGHPQPVFVKDEEKLLVSYATRDHQMYLITVAAGKSFYVGQLWINDAEDDASSKQEAEEWLSTVESLSRSRKAAAKKPDERIFLGKYPQDSEDGEDPIEWIKLKEEDDKVLLITKYAILYRPMHDPALNEDDVSGLLSHRFETLQASPEKYTWKGSTLRNWLNTDFYESVFTDEEKSRILTTEYYGEKKENKEYIPSDKLKDKVFILSRSEAKEYFATNTRRKAKWSSNVRRKATARYLAYWGEGFGDWWLLTDCGDGFVSVVSEAGGFNKKPADIEVSIRPVIWVRK